MKKNILKRQDKFKSLKNLYNAVIINSSLKYVKKARLRLLPKAPGVYRLFEGADSAPTAKH